MPKHESIVQILHVELQVKMQVDVEAYLHKELNFPCMLDKRFCRTWIIGDHPWDGG